MESNEVLAFRTPRAADFFTEPGLTAECGHPRDEWALALVRELVDNAIDAAEEAGRPPRIEIETTAGRTIVRDNGHGIPADVVADICNPEIRVSSRSLYAAPTRGRQDNAWKTVLGIAYVLGDGRARIEIASCGTRHTIHLSANDLTGVPDIKIESVEDRTCADGTEIVVYWPAEAAGLLEQTSEAFLQLVDGFAYTNPHLTINATWLGGSRAYTATDPEWGKWRPSDPTSPWWYTVETFGRLIAATIADLQRRGCDVTVREFIAQFAGMKGTTRQKVVLDALDLHRASLSVLTDGSQLNTDLIGALLCKMQELVKPIRAKKLGLVGKEHLRTRMIACGAMPESFRYRKRLSQEDNVPRVVECAFAYCPDADGRQLICGVNWSATPGTPFRDLGEERESLDGLLRQLEATPSQPVIVFAHMACPNVVFTDRAKAAVAA